MVQQIELMPIDSKKTNISGFEVMPGASMFQVATALFLQDHSGVDKYTWVVQKTLYFLLTESYST